MSARARDKVSCFDCEAHVILKNLKIHYDRFHPGKTVKHRSINQKSIFKLDLLSTNKRKLEDADSEKVHKKMSTEETSSLVDVPPITSKNSENSSIPDTGVDIPEKEHISVDKDTMNTLLLSIKGKKYSFSSYIIIPFL